MGERQATAGKPFPWVGSLLTLGIGLRGVHYLRNPSMWHDEAALILNVLDRSFVELLGPLTFSEAAPPLFLWLEKVVVGILGDGTYALRLLPLMASCLTLVGVVAVARRVLTPAAVPWAALLTAVSDRLLWHSCEAKPYATDALVAVSLMLLVVWGASRPLWQQLVAAGVATPVLIFLSYPACFLLGGLVLAWLPAVLRGRRLPEAVLYLVLLGVLAGSFVLLLAGPVRAQRDETLRACWEDMFPPWNRPALVPGWLGVRLSEVARYAEEPVGNGLVGVAAVGGILLWRAGRRRLVVFLLAPIGLAALAALLGQYPLGATRVMVFAAPAVLLLTASGLPPTLDWLSRWGRAAPVCLIGLTLFPLGQAVYRVAWPWDRADADHAAAYVVAHRQPGEVVLGTNWEHDYYFRSLGAEYRAADRSPPRDVSGRVWLLATGKTEERRHGWLRDFAAPECARVLGRRDFAQVTVLYLEVPAGVPAFGQHGER
jgi:hypothetical protein